MLRKIKGKALLLLISTNVYQMPSRALDSIHHRVTQPLVIRKFWAIEQIREKLVLPIPMVVTLHIEYYGWKGRVCGVRSRHPCF